MAQNKSNILQHWSFLGFAKSFGSQLGAGMCINHKTGEEFPSCTFTKGGKRTFVHFGPSLKGGLDVNEMVARRNGLQVLELEVPEATKARRRQAGRQEETYVLCVVGESSWESVDLSAYLED